MTKTLKSLNHAEVVEFDHDVLAELCARHGHRAEEVIAAALGQIEQLLSLAKLQLNAEHTGGLARTCADLTLLARAIGMRTLQRAATAVGDCLRQGNTCALPACTERMLRLGHPETISRWTVRHDTVA